MQQGSIIESGFNTWHVPQASATAGILPYLLILRWWPVWWQALLLWPGNLPWLYGFLCGHGVWLGRDGSAEEARGSLSETVTGVEGSEVSVSFRFVCDGQSGDGQSSEQETALEPRARTGAAVAPRALRPVRPSESSEGPR